VSSELGLATVEQQMLETSDWNSISELGEKNVTPCTRPTSVNSSLAALRRCPYEYGDDPRPIRDAQLYSIAHPAENAARKTMAAKHLSSRLRGRGLLASYRHPMFNFRVASL
jgi:hypothetical protein